MANFYSESAGLIPLSKEQYEVLQEKMLEEVFHGEEVTWQDAVSELELSELELKYEQGHLYYHAKDLNSFDWLTLALWKTFEATNDTRTLTLEWADTCSEPRAGAFGGGAYVITANGVHAIETGQLGSYYAVLRSKSAALTIAALQYLVDIAEFGIEEEPDSLQSHAREAKKIISELKGES